MVLQNFRFNLNTLRVLEVEQKVVVLHLQLLHQVLMLQLVQPRLVLDELAGSLYAGAQLLEFRFLVGETEYKRE